MPYFALRPRLAASLRRMANRLDPQPIWGKGQFRPGP